LRLLGFGEGDHVADARGAAEERHRAIEAESDAAVRGRPVLERPQHIAKTAFYDVLRDFEHVLEYLFLQRGLVDADRAATELHAIQNDVVVLAAHLLRRAVEQMNILGHRRGERVMRGEVALFCLVEGHQRKIHDPQKFPVVGTDRELAALLEQRSALEADAAEDRAGFFPRRRGEENDVAVGDAEAFLQCRLFGVAEEFRDRRFPLAILDFDEGEPLRPERFGNIFQVLELTLRDVGEALAVERFHHAAARDRRLENLEAGVLERVAEVGQFEPETQVGLVDAEAVHRLDEGHPAGTASGCPPRGFPSRFSSACPRKSA